jgi:hypothetical protein
MKITKQKIKIKCVFLILLLSASFVEAYPPDNAAVLYYRAFLVVKEPGEEVSKMMTDMRVGKIKSNEKVRQYIEENRRVIEMLETAADIPICDWGHDLSKGFDLLMPGLAKIRRTAFLLAADAQVLLEDGEHKKALEKCLTMHKIARHVGDDTIISFLVGTSLNTLANKRIVDVLSDMPDDPGTLQWLKSRIVGISNNIVSIRAAMNREREMSALEIRKERIGAILDAVGEEALSESANANVIKKIRNADEKFFADSRAYYTNVMNNVIVALNLPYQQSHRTLTELNERIRKDAKKNEAAVLTNILTPAVTKVCSAETKNKTFFNAIIAAIDVHTVKARTGRLPAELPEGSAKDLFSGQDFEYKKTKDGFTLRCRGKDLDKDEIYQYDFKVAK